MLDLELAVNFQSPIRRETTTLVFKYTRHWGRSCDVGNSRAFYRRNVSVLGLAGLFSSSASVSLVSFVKEDGESWLVPSANTLIRALGRALGCSRPPCA